MKTRIFIGTLVALQWVGISLQAGEMIALHAKPGSKMRIEGTSPAHDWQVESKIIGGSIQVDPNFPTTPGQEVKPGKIEVRGQAVIFTRSLQSVEKNGTHYSDKMDETMWGKLKVNDFKSILYIPSELSLKEAPKSKDAPYVFDAKGEVMVGGVTNVVTMPVNVLPMADGKVKISGTVSMKMSSFKIEPVALLGTIKIGDEVKLIFDWMVGPAKPTAAAKQ